MDKHLENVDLLKGICILIVIFEHASWSYSEWCSMLLPIWDRFSIPCFMVISGYLYARSFAMNNESIKEYYSKNVFKRLFRYLFPFVIAYLIEMVAIFICCKTSILSSLGYVSNSNINSYLDIKKIVIGLISGGYGPGNYYTPVIIELTLIFPLLYKLIKKYGYKGLVGSFVFCLLSELWQYYFSIPNSIYRLLVFRHVFTICFGIYVYLGYWKKNKVLNIVSLLVGLTYIIGHSYFGFVPYFFNRGWADVNFVACLFFVVIAGTLIECKNLKCGLLEEFGKASYHIYLTQMVYYFLVKKEIMMSIINNQYLYVLISLLVCSICGYVFYLITNKLIHRK